jgi:hypothetical protein
MLNRIAIVVVAAALGSAAIATDAVARGDGGAGHGGGAMSGGRIGGGFSGGHFAGRFKHGHHGRARGLTVPFGYYDDSYSGDYDPSVTPDEQPAYPTTAYPDVQPNYPPTCGPPIPPRLTPTCSRRVRVAAHRLIPTRSDQNPCAQSRSPMDMILQG